MRRASLAIAATFLLPACMATFDEPRNPQEILATHRAAELLWSVESESGAKLGSATAFSPGRLLTSASAVENWIGQKLRVRQGTTVVPVRSMQLATRQNFAILNVQTDEIQAPMQSPRPAPDARIAIAGSNAGNSFTGIGTVMRRTRAFDGIRNIDNLIIADLPAARGFSGAPVVTVDGRLVGIASSLFRRQYFDPGIPSVVAPGTPIPRRAIAVLPMEVIQQTMRVEDLN